MQKMHLGTKIIHKKKFYKHGYLVNAFFNKVLKGIELYIGSCNLCMEG